MSENRSEDAGRTMRAAVLEAGEGGATLRVGAVPTREPGAGEVLVRLSAAALNRRDLWITKGKYGGIKLPCVLGADGAGVVAAVGAGVDAGLLGQAVIINPALGWGDDQAVPGPRFRVLGMPDPGTFAEEIVVAAEQLAPKPAHLSFAEAAALPLAGLTAYRATRRGRLRPGEALLLPGIGSGVQTMALMFARHLGARVAVTSSSPDKLARAQALGAAFGISHREPDWEKRLVKGFGAPDLVIDGAGGETLARCLAAVRPGGRMVCYGASAGPMTLELTRVFWKQVDILGSTMGSPADFREMVALVGAGLLRPTVDAVLPLEQAAQALARMERGDHQGKIVLSIGNRGAEAALAT